MFPVLDFDPVPEPAAPTSALAMFAISCLNRTLLNRVQSFRKPNAQDQSRPAAGTAGSLQFLNWERQDRAQWVQRPILMNLTRLDIPAEGGAALHERRTNMVREG